VGRALLPAQPNEVRQDLQAVSKSWRLFFLQDFVWQRISAARWNTSGKRLMALEHGTRMHGPPWLSGSPA